MLWAEVAHTGVSAREHITALVSDKLRWIGVMPSDALPNVENGRKVWVGPVTADGQGYRLPGAGGRRGLINVVLSPKVYETSRKALQSPFVVVEGRLQKRGQVISILARKVIPSKVEKG